MKTSVLLSLSALLLCNAAVRAAEAPKRVKIQLRDGRVVEGVLVDKTAKMMTVKEAGGNLRAFPASDVKKLEYVTVKLPSAREVAAAFAKKAGPLLAQKTRGKVIKFSGARVYGNLGKRNGIAVGMTFTVNDEGEKLVDPDTGEVLGSERKLIGRVKVIEVQEKFFKAVHIGDTEPSYKAGQVVELEGASNAVAVFPFVIEGKNLTYTALSYLILESLIAAKVKVVERELLAAALVEQGISNTFLADPATAQKMGKIVGARHIVTGIARPGATNTIQVRLINVATAGIAMAKTYELAEQIVPAGSLTTSSGSRVPPTHNPPPSDTGRLHVHPSAIPGPATDGDWVELVDKRTMKNWKVIRGTWSPVEALKGGVAGAIQSEYPLPKGDFILHAKGSVGHGDRSSWNNRPVSMIFCRQPTSIKGGYVLSIGDNRRYFEREGTVHVNKGGGQFKSFFVIRRGKQLLCYINDTLLVDYEDPKPLTGTLLLFSTNRQGRFTLTSVRIRPILVGDQIVAPNGDVLLKARNDTCPVNVGAPARDAFQMEYKSLKIRFSSAQALATFKTAPDRYVGNLPPGMRRIARERK